MDKEQAVTLVEYNIWANHKVILKAARLTSAELLPENIPSATTQFWERSCTPWIHSITGDRERKLENYPHRSSPRQIFPILPRFVADGRRRIAYCWIMSRVCQQPN